MQATITGIPELDRKLANLATKTAKKAARSALGKGMTVLVKSIKSAVPPATTEGHSNRDIKRSIGKKQKRQKQTGIVSAVVGIDVGKKKASQKPQSHLIALGTVERTRDHVGGKFEGRVVSNRRTGKIEGNDFVGAGYRAAAGEAINVMLKAADAVIQKEAK